MPLFRRNIELRHALPLSSWRKVAIGTWRSCGDPSVYGIADLPARPALEYLEKLKAGTDARITLTHFTGKAIAQVLARHPELNSILRLGRLYPRQTVDIFFQVASDERGRDLSGTTIREANHKSIETIALEMQERVEAIRSRGDPEFSRMKGLFGILPGVLAGPLLTISGFLMYTLNLWSPLFGSPRDPFGSAMITNVGSLGIETAFAPLVPYSRVPLLISMGAVLDKPVVQDGQVVVAPMLRLCITFDHRLIDGVHAARMYRTLEAIFRDPERELGGA
jgi:pyruvate/2-oxoglutarate dehydrogenase complex dihydrolipoamide acyltransferase (E2) component